ncbi:MAG: hypothetical protein AAGH99_11985 [Planctomycetota bacterium]
MPLDNHQGEMFGRRADITKLTEKAQSPGFTAVVARPQAGKTWTLHAIGHGLAQQGSLVGYHEITAEQEPIKYALIDLYTRWLASASFLKQGQSLLKRHQNRLVTGAGQAVGRLAEAVLGLGQTASAGTLPLKDVGKPVREAFDGLARAQTDLQTAGLVVPPLTRELTRDLLQVLYDLTGKPAVLVLDAWEKSRRLKDDQDVVSYWLSHRNDWPPLHIFAGVRRPDPDDPDRGDEGLRAAEQLDQVFASASIYPLLHMDLTDKAERANLLDHVRVAFPAAADLSDDELLAMIGGSDASNLEPFAGVLGRWRESTQAQIADAEALSNTADDAHHYRYGELKTLYQSLDGDAKKIALRLALLPRMDPTIWEAVRDAVLLGCEEEQLDLLKERELLLDNGPSDPPTFGHDTRHAAASRYAAEVYKTAASREADQLAVEIASAITNTTEQTLPHSICLIEISQYQERLNLSASTIQIWRAAMTLFGIPQLSIQLGDIQAPVIDKCCVLIAIALFNTLNHAKQKNDLERRDQILQEIRELQKQYPQEAVNEKLAKALFNTLNHTKQENDLERRDQILQEIRELQKEHPQEAVNEKLAKALAVYSVEKLETEDWEESQPFIADLTQLITDQDDKISEEARRVTRFLQQWLRDKKPPST